MKKLLHFIICVILLTFVACSNSDEVPPSSSEPEESEVSATPELEDTENETEIVVPVQEESEGLIGLPAIEAPAAFRNIYMGNYIDEQYVIDLDNAENLTEMIIICEDTAFSWRIAIDNIYSKLIEIMDEVQRNDLEVAHNAWNNDVPIMINEIEDEVKELGSVGGFEAAQKIMYIYRNRAIELALMYYELEGEVILPPDIGEAVG